MFYNFLFLIVLNASFHTTGWNSISSGNNSSLPANISNIRTNFEKEVKQLKFCVGPTNSRPGPMLLIVAVTAVKLVTKSLPSSEMAKSEQTKIIINVMKYTFIERTTSLSTGFPSMAILLMLFGWI